jgi:hypothetical protein
VSGFLGVFLVCGIPPLQQHKITILGFLCRLAVFLCLVFAFEREKEPTLELPKYSILPIFGSKTGLFFMGFELGKNRVRA